MISLNNGYAFGKVHIWSYDNEIENEGIILVINKYYNEGVFCKKINCIKGIITLDLSETSHCIILAKSYDIPVIAVNLSEIEKITNDHYIFIEAKAGATNFNLCETRELWDKYQKKCDEYLLEKKKKLYLKDVKCISSNGRETKIFANLIVPEEVHRVVELGGEGIGVYRTEFLFLNRNDLPSEEEQFISYKYVAENMDNKTVVIRTIDIGGDKKIDYLNIEREENPFLGCRGIRFCLRNIDIFKTQLRAILRASVYGNVSILLPMVTTLEEVLESKKIIELCKKELKSEGELFCDVKLGIMVEVPAVAYQIHRFTEHVDFLSIGTNDLIQYFYAADRTNSKVCNLYKQSDEVFFDLIKNVIDIAHSKKISCTVCGEMASNPDTIKRLLEYEIDELSVSTSLILDTKENVITCI
ncbi:phosphoenolpyruvate--protein phosphotransferase [Paenibacillus zanthoxyli]|uniref:phosphoenolpyruvate--protein phosphotransferase n=1 Tax=Paenibacillus zanthoxyli TaxID=369399 RepID=UPI0004703BA1|nr:phosphoenolpyruvate--protein phosphotransferase [Paenibacillus zanthoxyli]